MVGILREEEINQLLTDLIDTYGYDFTGYSMPMLQRRINQFYNLQQAGNFPALRYLLKNDPQYFRLFISKIMVPVTEMFRDPSFFAALRTAILPALSNFPLIRIWHAGCSTGEEVYSMAILLKELHLLHKSILYATDINPEALETASKGIFPQKPFQHYADNYLKAGGELLLQNYYGPYFGQVKFLDELKKRMVFSTHNLAADTSFNQFQLVICRNVLIYFNQDMQNRVFTLFDSSLESKGFLALGSKETLRFSHLNQHYQKANLKEKIWQKL